MDNWKYVISMKQKLKLKWLQLFEDEMSGTKLQLINS